MHLNQILRLILCALYLHAYQNTNHILHIFLGMPTGFEKSVFKLKFSNGLETSLKSLKLVLLQNFTHIFTDANQF